MHEYLSQLGSHTTWAQHIGWDATIRPLNDAEYDHLPKIKELRKLVQRSFTVPAWLADLDSPQYDLFRLHTDQFRLDAERLASGVSRPEYTKNKDDKLLSTDVAGCLPNLLQIVRQVYSLQVTVGFDPMEADRRHPIDTLGSLVWDTQSKGLVYRVDLKLQIPGPLGCATWTRPDACALIQVFNGPATQAPANLRHALSCFPDVVEPECHNVLHWVTEFKRAGDVEVSKQQVVEGLVSALYQRRALGFPNHFVFGTAHHSKTTLEVLAATWVPSEPVDPEAESIEEVGRQSAGPSVDQQENGPERDSSLKGDTTGGTSKAGPKLAGEGSNLTAKDIKAYNKIVVYSIATYKMGRVQDLLQLYLLMRATRSTVDEYKREIMKHGDALIDRLSKEAPDIYQWPPLPPPPPPPPDSDRARSTASKRPGLGDLPEGGDSMPVDGYDDSDSGFDQEEHDSASDVGCKHGVIGDTYVQTVTGDVATYTLKNYAYEADAGAGIVGEPYIVQ